MFLYVYDVHGHKHTYASMNSRRRMRTQVTTLKSVFMQKNFLEKLPPEIALLTNVTELNLSDNLMEHLCPEIKYLTALINIQLTGMLLHISQLRMRAYRLSPSLGTLPLECAYSVCLCATTSSPVHSLFTKYSLTLSHSCPPEVKASLPQTSKFSRRKSWIPYLTTLS